MVLLEYGAGRAVKLTIVLQIGSFRTLMAKYRAWADQLFPSLTFEDFVDRLELLGGQRAVRVRRGLCWGCFAGGALLGSYFV